MKALATIRNEHRSIAAVLEGLRYVVDAVGGGRMAPDFALMDAMLRYIEAFPERLHHPKEDDYLFPALLKRRPDLEPLIRGLEREHADGRDAIVALKRALEEFRASGAAGQPAFAAALARYVDFHWKHMNSEEQQVLPAAEQALTADDWAPIDAAFASNDDPLVGVDATREMRELFRRIANLAPPPIGVGPDRSGPR
jgi:branched-chain amino acid transport system ATP-binding protein